MVTKLNEIQQKTHNQLQKMRKSFHDLKQEFHKETDILKKNKIERLELNNTMQEIKTTLKSINSRLDYAEKSLTLKTKLLTQSKQLRRM